jgi:hypothetical protein
MDGLGSVFAYDKVETNHYGDYPGGLAKGQKNDNRYSHVAVSEVVLGVALILGIFVGLTAFFAGFVNWNFIMAGSASVNGIFLVLAVLLILAWKIDGYLGLDYYLLPRIANLWTPASVHSTPVDPATTGKISRKTAKKK